MAGCGVVPPVSETPGVPDDAAAGLAKEPLGCKDLRALRLLRVGDALGRGRHVLRPVWSMGGPGARAPIPGAQRLGPELLHDPWQAAWRVRVPAPPARTVEAAAYRQGPVR